MLSHSLHVMTTHSTLRCCPKDCVLLIQLLHRLSKRDLGSCTIGHKTQTSIWSAWLKEKLQESHLLANYRSSGKFSFIQLLQADRTVRLSEKGKASFLPEFIPCWQQQDRFSYLTPSISEVTIEWTFKWDSLYSNHHFFTVIPLYPIYIHRLMA